MPDLQPSEPVSVPAPEETKAVSADKQKDEENKEIVKVFKTKVEGAKRNRKSYYGEWKRNVELRIGKVASAYTVGTAPEDEVQSELNPDWSLTKTKTANLYSQVPQVQGTHENKQYAPAVPPFMKALNYELSEKRANIGVAMEEVLNDVVNASGVGAIFVGYAARTESVEMPAEETVQGPQGPVATKSLPPQTLQQLVKEGMVHMIPTERVISDKIFGSRISPLDLLWPDEFNGSNFDDSDWIGHTGKAPWAIAKVEFKLKDEDKDELLGATEETTTETLRSSAMQSTRRDSKLVMFDEIFYWRIRVDPEEKCFDCIWRIVFVKGREEPVIHEPWKGQRKDEQTGKYLGAKKFPIRVLTLTYITDNPIPPSDSSAGRPQVNDLRRSRRQMFQNRERSVPIRWFDVNRIDPLIQAQLMNGTWQGMIPTNGDGSRSIGEIARASYPAEDQSFDQAAKTDLMESWQIGPNQLGTNSPGKKTSAESNIVQQNFATRIGQERGRVSSFFLGVCDVIAGHMVLFSDFPNLTDQERSAMQQAWDQKHILHDLVLKVRPDSTVVLDTQARIARLMQFLNMTAKSGFVNPKPIIVEIAELSGLDPSEVVIDPQPKVDKPNISLRLSGKEDLINPLAVALLLHDNKLSVEEIENAKQLLLSVQQAPKPPEQSGGAGPDGVPGPHPPGPGAPAGQEAHPDWHTASKVAKRSRDMGEGGGGN